MTEINSTFPVIILGAGGHARLLIEILKSDGKHQIKGILDPAIKSGESISGVTVLGDDRIISNFKDHYAVIGVGSVCDNTPRKKIFSDCIQSGLKPLQIIHSKSIICPSAKLGSGIQVLMGAIINSHAKIEDNVIINTGAIIEHDCLIKSHVHIASGACLAGKVKVGEGSFIGAGAVVIQGVSIGSGCIVGAGAVVVRDLPDNSKVAGNPAKPI